jgi:hypothetical protein
MDWLNLTQTRTISAAGPVHEVMDEKAPWICIVHIQPIYERIIALTDAFCYFFGSPREA